jgi:hypothetical protein
MVHRALTLGKQYASDLTKLAQNGEPVGPNAKAAVAAILKVVDQRVADIKSNESNPHLVISDDVNSYIAQLKSKETPLTIGGKQFHPPASVIDAAQKQISAKYYIGFP